MSVWFCLILSFMILLVIEDTTAVASSNMLDDRNVLITYYGTDDATMANVHFLDSTLSGLFEHVVIRELKHVEEADLKKHDIIIYYSAKEGVNREKLNLFIDFEGDVLAVGKEANALPQFRDWKFSGIDSINYIEDIGLDTPIELLVANPPDSAMVLVDGKKFNEHFPVVIQDGKYSFITISSLFADGRDVLTAVFFDLFQLPKPNAHPAYIRLEDISPVSDPELVYEAGTYLLDKNIPVYLAVIPAYANPDTGDMMTLSDKPKLIDAIDALIKRGAYIISHGYTHTYRYEETGEGFEFWDSVLNQPITTLNQEDIPERIKPADQFLNKEEYGQYIQEINQVESDYINTKLENSIHTLSKLGYAPIAFEAPHYTMSSNGYKITSHYFSAIFGQIQTSDKNWQVMFSPLFISHPTILNGMTLYPETIGFVDPNSIDPIRDMEKVVNEVIQVPGSVLGGFYHPYLGLDYLKEMVALIEKVPNVEWIELKNEKHYVKTDYVEIVTTENGEIKVDSDLSWMKNIKDKLAGNSFEKYLWMIVIVTAIFVILFIVHIMMLRVHYRKRLFKERADG